MINKITLDAALNQLSSHILCESCVKTYYAEEVSQLQGPPQVYVPHQGICHVCHRKSECYSSTYLQRIIYRGKRTQELVRIVTEQGTKEPMRTIVGTVGIGSAGVRELVERGTRGLPAIYFHLSRQQISNTPQAGENAVVVWAKVLQMILKENSSGIPENPYDIGDWLFMKWMTHESFKNLPLVEK